jgi:hypothetical protein
MVGLMLNSLQCAQACVYTGVTSTCSVKKIKVLAKQDTWPGKRTFYRIHDRTNG